MVATLPSLGFALRQVRKVTNSLSFSTYYLPRTRLYPTLPTNKVFYGFYNLDVLQALAGSSGTLWLNEMPLVTKKWGRITSACHFYVSILNIIFRYFSTCYALLAYRLTTLSLIFNSPMRKKLR
jgi:hypothetical protein